MNATLSRRDSAHRSHPAWWEFLLAAIAFLIGVLVF